MLDGVVSRHLSGNTHATLNAAFAEPAMPEVPEEEGALRVRIERSYAQVSVNDLPRVAQCILIRGNLTAAMRQRAMHEKTGQLVDVVSEAVRERSSGP